MGHAAGSVCCVAWKDDQQFATASADHVIHVHSGGQACTASLRGGMRDLTHLTWSPCGKPHTQIRLSCMLQVAASLGLFCPSVSFVHHVLKDEPQQLLTLHGDGTSVHRQLVCFAL